MDLFDEDEDAEPEEQAQLGDAAGEEDAEFRVNKSYANRFEQRKKKQVRSLRRLPECAGLLSTAPALRWRCATGSASGG